MVDHIDENSETSETKSLDQSAIDDALASMQVDESGEAAAEADPAAHSNGGETFAAPQSDGHEDLDAAIAALQADEPEDAAFDIADSTESGEASQDDIDAALAAMQADATTTEAAVEADPPESGEASQDDIDTALAAMQADATTAEAAVEADPPESGEASQDDIDAAIAAMQTDATTDEELSDVQAAETAAPAQDDIDAAFEEAQADEISPQEGGQSKPTVAEDGDDIDASSAAMQDDRNDDLAEDTAETDDGSQEDIDATIAALQEEGTDGKIAEEGVDADADDVGKDDIDAAIAAMQDDDTIESTDSQSQADREPLASEPDLGAGEANPTEAADDANTFAGLDEDNPIDSGSSPPASGVDGEAGLKSAPDSGDDFSGLDGEDTKPTKAEAAEVPETIKETTAAATDSQNQTAVESLPEVKVDKSGANTSAASTGSRRFGKKWIGIAALCLLVVAGSAVYFGRDLYSAYRNKTAPAAVEEPVVEPAPVMTETAPVQSVAVKNPYQEKLQEVARLRADLLSKKDEIDRLRQFYRDGISELEEELHQEATRQGVHKLSAAIANNKIKLDLQSIQRRWAYIDELAKPYHWLQQGSEELLFLSRRTEIDLQIDAIASGIELTRHMRRMNASMQKYQLSPERLAIDISNSRLRPVEEIWQAISTQNKAIAKKAVANGDQAIIDEICSGDTGRIAELTTLTIKASKCLSQLDTSELFLNRLTFLSPVAAKYLSNWRGQWLCLNGFRELTPEVARHLFRWEGNWISLNGLQDFSPRIGELLLSWEGHQLELMGLKLKAGQSEKIGLQQLSDWETTGGKLFVPDAIRAEMEKLN